MRENSIGSLFLAAFISLVLNLPSGHGDTRLDLTKIGLPPTEPSADDALLDIARHSGINVIVDDRQVPVQAAAITIAPQSTAIWSLLQSTNQGSLSLLRVAPETFLFWRRPDVAKLYQRISREDTSIEGPLQMSSFAQGTEAVELADWLRQNHGWDGRDYEIFPLDIMADELPADLAMRLTVGRRRAIFGYSIALRREWFTDAFWRNSQLMIRESAGNKKTDSSALFMIVHNVPGVSKSSMSLAPVDQTPR